MEVVYFSWLDKAVEVQEGVELPQFALIGTILNDCSTNYTTGQLRTSQTPRSRTVLR